VDPPAEFVLIEAAWSALDHGDSAAALAALRRHLHHYPTGRLAEERDALRVLALARSGRTAEARERADSFRAEHPRSIHLAAIQAALRKAGGEP
jgi:outer membrane protein assembly factor BamD (BamD/ComL family)